MEYKKYEKPCNYENIKVNKAFEYMICTRIRRHYIVSFAE